MSEVLASRYESRLTPPTQSEFHFENREQSRDSKIKKAIVPPTILPSLPPPDDVLPKEQSDLEEKSKEISEESSFHPVAHFGTPFSTSSGTEIGLTSHPQVIMARTVEDCIHTMAVGREMTTKTIIEVDLKKQEELSQEFYEKLRASIEKARESKQLSYVQNALKLLSTCVGIGGGVIVSFASISAGNGYGVLTGMEMTLGGLLSLGSFCLDQMGSEQTTWSSLLAIGGGILSLHGGIMGFPLLADQLPAHLASIYSGAISLLRGYGMFKQMDYDAALTEFSAEFTYLSTEKKDLSDTLKKHYEALNITDFAHFFKAATTFIAESSRATKKIIQGTH